MTWYRWFLGIVLVSALTSVTWAAPAEDVKLSSIFSDNMVIQRGDKVPVWGTAKPGGDVTVKFLDQTKRATVDADGTWSVTLDAVKAGGPYDLTVDCATPVTLKNVMTGDVWICSGQSNMVMSVNLWGRDKALAAKNIAAANYPNIRLFQVKRNISYTPLDELAQDDEWQICSPKTIGSFTAAGYFFGRELYEELKVPIGLISSNWGGTIVEAWTSEPMNRLHPDMNKRVDSRDRRAKGMDKKRKEYETKLAKFLSDEKKLISYFRDNQKQSPMAAASLNDADWKTMTVPGPWEKASLGKFDGAVWFRKTVDLPANWAGKDLVLQPGPIDEIDVAFFNGQRVGGRGSVKPYINKYWSEPRVYNVPGELVKAGKNAIAIMVADLNGEGGLWGAPADTLKLTLKSDPSQSVALAGEWKYKPEVEVFAKPKNPFSPNQPAVLYNAMINPLVRFPIAGAIWYQGESNARRAYQYQSIFPALIQDWRIRWDKDFPFYFVQLANFKARNEKPVESDWAELREAQTMALRLPNTGMAVTIDIGEAKDIHPVNKEDVGKRLAANALAGHYGKNVTPCGPIYDKMKIKGDQIQVFFKHVDGGLEIKGGGPLKGFAIAGEDKKFVWADASIKGDSVIVHSDNVAKPVAVRYGWANNPDVNLYNKAGYPASPFRSDSWPGVTINCH